MELKESLKKSAIVYLMTILVIAVIAGVSACFSVGVKGEPFFIAVGIILIVALIVGLSLIFKKRSDKIQHK